MKYWKGIIGTPKQDMCGTMGDNGCVPDSVEIGEVIYDEFVAAQPIIEPVNENVEFEDIESGKKYIMRKVKT